MAPDGRLIDDHQLELAQVLCEEALDTVRQQLLGSFAPWDGLRRRNLLLLLRVWWRLRELERLIGALRSPDLPAPPP